ncbi:Na+/H+ antiporter NhaA [Nonlabens antarcticus]|uniref:Na+/H+ antiporter NhaA n=1 Tax=Nonlabens antarcticus TaxID=392714 RepID=UPI00189158AF|nr:Na+/H+ antiporter NhaA [Nonlabens antarcticus]
MHKITAYFKTFFQKDSSTGILLIAATVAALIVANSPFRQNYHDFMELKFTVGFTDLNISKSLHHWVNDGLMAFFFLLVGLEIKGELKFGKLNSFNSAVFPVVAAVSGAALPALIFWIFNQNTEYIDGWAIPMATDIAFVIGILAMIGSRVPSWVKVFVTTIAVVDDLIAILIIALFYTEQINWTPLGIAALCAIALGVLNYRKVNSLTPYLCIGFFLWWAILASGIHATIAGVIVAFTIPLNRKWNLEQIQGFATEGFNQFKKAKDRTLSNTTQQAHYYLENTQRDMESPLRRLERKLHDPVYFFIMPLFAFVNAGIFMDLEILSQAFQTTVTWGVILGLLLGKPIGIMLAIWILLKVFYRDIPTSPTIWKVLLGIALLCGIGFTMSLFIANLSFNDDVLLQDAKMGILTASLVSGFLGYYILYQSTRKQKDLQKGTLGFGDETQDDSNESEEKQ